MYKCTICPAEFKTAQGLANHKCRWVCGECGKKLTTPDEYGKHLKRHESAKKREETKRLKALEEQARYQEQRENKRKELDAKYQKLLDLGLFNPLYNQGDTVIVSSYIALPALI